MRSMSEGGSGYHSGQTLYYTVPSFRRGAPRRVSGTVTLVEQLPDGRWLVDRGDRKTRVSEKTLAKDYVDEKKAAELKREGEG